MQKIVTKGLRTYRPYVLKLDMRPELYEWFTQMSVELDCNITVFVRGLLEDARDRYLAEQELAAVRATIPVDEEAAV